MGRPPPARHPADTLADGLGPDEHLLIADRDGQVLETDRANVFAVIDGVLVTPPADGRILPGVTRAAVLRLAARDGCPVREEPITTARLLAASEVFVTNSVAGLVPARSLDQPAATWPSRASGPVARRLRAALARRPVPSPRPSPRPGPGRRTPGHPAAAAAGPAPVIVLIDNYDSFTYNLAHLLLGHGSQVEVVRNDEVTADDIARLRPDGIVISPGPCTPAEAGISVAAVRACAATTPLLGICLGHQAIAAAYGARITAAPEPVHGQAATITHDGRGLLSGLPPRFRAARYHSLIVDEATLPPALTITARGPGGLPMGLRHGEHPAEGVQFHPESILTPHGRRIIGNFTAAARSQPAPPISPAASIRLSQVGTIQAGRAKSMALPKIVSEQEWEQARGELLTAEKQATRALDALAAQRRRLPMVRFGADYVFDTPAGPRPWPSCSTAGTSSWCTSSWTEGPTSSAPAAPRSPTTSPTWTVWPRPGHLGQRVGHAAGPDPGLPGEDGLDGAVRVVAGHLVLPRLRRRRRLRAERLPAGRRRRLPDLLHHGPGRGPGDVPAQHPRPVPVRAAGGLGGLPGRLAAAAHLRLAAAG